MTRKWFSLIGLVLGTALLALEASPAHAPSALSGTVASADIQQAEATPASGTCCLDNAICCHEKGKVMVCRCCISVPCKH